MLLGLKKLTVQENRLSENSGAFEIKRKFKPHRCEGCFSDSADMNRLIRRLLISTEFSLEVHSRPRTYIRFVRFAYCKEKGGSRPIYIAKSTRLETGTMQVTYQTGISVGEGVIRQYTNQCVL